MARLLDGEFAIVYFDLIQAVGAARAIILQQLYFWAENNRDPDVQIDTENGKRWVRISLDDMSERLGLCWSPRTLSRYLGELHAADLIETAQLNSSPWDQTVSYSVNREAVHDLSGSIMPDPAASKTPEATGSNESDPAGSLLEEPPQENNKNITQDLGTELIKYVEQTTGLHVRFDYIVVWKELVTKYGIVAMTWAVDETMKQRDDPHKKAYNPRYVGKVVESYGDTNVVKVDGGAEPSTGASEYQVRWFENEDGTKYAVQFRREDMGEWVPVDGSI